MCGEHGNLIAEGFGVAVIVGRYLWVAHQGRSAVIEAEAMVEETPVGADEPATASIGAR